MDNSQINQKDRRQLADETIKKLSDLRSDVLTLVLTQYCLELTISARACFLERKIEPARECNEALHKILGYVAAEMRCEIGPGQKDAFIKMIVESASHKGWLLLLRSAIKKAIHH